MQERELRGMIARVKSGRLSRRSFVQKMMALGLTAPMAGLMLHHSGVAFAAETFKYKPTKAGGGGPLKCLLWQAPTLLNPHFAVGSKDQEASSIFYEPLAGWDLDGNLQLVLAAEIPDVENGGLSKDGLSVTWKLKQGVKWHDGKPFTADDVVFTWKYASDPATATYTVATYQAITVDKIDDHTVKINFKKPTPFWPDPFVGVNGMILPKHLFEDYSGAKSREAPANLSPVGTGPFLFVDFKPGDSVRGKINPNYHIANRPYFDTFEIKGGGDAISAARAVLQTGEYDMGWNLQVEDEVLKRLENGGKGHVALLPGGNIEHMQCNFTDPWKDVDGERSSLTTKHPSLSDKSVRDALALLIDKASVEKFIYGRTGQATANFVNNPKKYASTNTHWEFNIEKANKILDDAGWKKGSDGVRAKNGNKLHYVFQTSINQPRQKTQAIIKQSCEKAGISMELKSVSASIYFSSDVGNPDTYPHFYTDLQMYTTTQPQPDPGVFMQQFLSDQAASKANKWQGRNITRWQSPEYDKTFHDSESELDPVKRAALLIKCNDLTIDNVVVIPVVYRPAVAGVRTDVKANMSGWTTYMWRLGDWYRET